MVADIVTLMGRVEKLGWHNTTWLEKEIGRTTPNHLISSCSHSSPIFLPSPSCGCGGGGGGGRQQRQQAHGRRRRRAAGGGVCGGRPERRMTDDGISGGRAARGRWDAG
ncbi:hypothetical protein [Oryza sativa Japonica Group]|uniref:Uncharacterized protein P0581F09.14 n=1 Tax=Oryza sativa subsp. japonica TaxID=39947 RepID=Q5N7F0_ORYSJ|nr:hypothetical protein [Oryza sativa Japonica Group]